MKENNCLDVNQDSKCIYNGWGKPTRQRVKYKLRNGTSAHPILQIDELYWHKQLLAMGIPERDMWVEEEPIPQGPLAKPDQSIKYGRTVKEIEELWMQ
jgi:hypothetical protein